ncbi:MAG: DEAD/DEAH box helicase, partial [Acidimicrobiaceae bacterium]|nr:DEAD/DEAH box helicase [Acidimicrobiaceae bacterium]
MSHGSTVGPAGVVGGRYRGGVVVDPLAVFSEPTRAWFTSAFAAPTAPQSEGWPAIAAGDHTLVCAPTGTGKTLAAFLWAIDRLMSQGTAEAGEGTRVLYVSPLRALAVDVEKNLRAPLHGIGLAAERLGVTVHEPTVGLRTGDTSADERRRLVRHPPNILITTPESLFLMLTSQARQILTGVQHVIIDEIHAVAAGKRGTHLMVSLERLEELCDQSPQRIALSATQRPLDEIARFLGGFTDDPGGSPVPRPVTVVDAGARKELDVEVVVPVADMASLGETVEAPASARAAASPLRRSIWPAIHPRLLELVRSHRSTLIFANARRLAERLAARLNELHLEAQDEESRNLGSIPMGPRHTTDPRFSGTGGDGPIHVGESVERMIQAPPPVPLSDEQVGSGPADGLELVKTHHGSLSRQRRLLIEDELKRGELRGLVATSTLELGIDMGAVDLVVQVASPGSVASGLQRIGRAGHRVGEPSRGRIFPKHRADLLEAAAVVERMHQGEVEHTRYLRNPIDVAAQQIVAMCAMDDWPVDRLATVLRRSAGFAELSDDVLYSVLELLSGTYPAEEFSELRPRVVWDRAGGVLRGRAGAQRLAVTNAGTIPDRGLFGVFLPDGTRVGELDEEMVYESRVGEVFLLGATTWRIVDITFERVVVTPAPGELGKMPFWHGDGPGRPIELGRAVGSLVRELRSGDDEAGKSRLRQRCGLDETAADNLVAYLEDQSAATGAVPDDRTVVVERFRDEIGDWRVCVLTPFGAQVHAPWGVALQARLREAWGVDVDLMWGDDGIVMRLPEAIDDLPLDDLLFDPDEIQELVVSRLPETSMFASRFRECAARALLLPRRRPDQRTPLWQQRQRAADLLSVAAKFPSFPILLETTRECLNDVFDLPALVGLMTDLRSRRIRMVAVDTPQASPFAQSLLFSWIAVYMYEGDAPLAERRAAALALDRDLLRDLLGAEELRELLDAGVITDVELELQRLVAGGQARDADELHDLLRVLGPLTLDELGARTAPSAGSDAERVAGWARTLVEQRRAIEVRLAGRDLVADAADAARLRDAAGAALPVGLPASATEPVDDPLGDLCVRYARSHGPFLARDVARWLGVGEQPVVARLSSLVAEGRLLRGEFRPGGAEREFCDADVLRRIRRRCLAALRQEVEPVPPEALARFLPDWQG